MSELHDSQILPPHPSCGQCNDLGAVKVEANRYKLCECSRENTVRAIIPRDYWGLSVAGLEPWGKLAPGISIGQQEKHIATIQSDPFAGYCFLGPTGVGKTWMAAACLSDAIRRGRRCYFVKCRRMLQAIEDERFGRLADSDAKNLITRWVLDGLDPVHLVIDDFDKIRATEETNNTLFDLIDYCTEERHRITLLVTTNLNLTAFVEMWGEPLMRRILRCCEPIEFIVEDNRG